MYKTMKKLSSFLALALVCNIVWTEEEYETVFPEYEEKSGDDDKNMFQFDTKNERLNGVEFKYSEENYNEGDKESTYRVSSELSAQPPLVAPKVLTLYCRFSDYFPSLQKMRQRSKNSGIRRQKPKKNEYTVGVYYYPWYGSDFNGGRYLRENLIPPQAPLLGQYNDHECEVIAQHLIWSHHSHVNLWVISWWGEGSGTDHTLRESILPNPLLDDLKVAIHYETGGRTATKSEQFTTLEKLGPDISYLCKTYFNHPNYLKIDGKPVVVMYLARSLQKRGLLLDAITIMRDAASMYPCNHELYLVGDMAFGSFSQKRNRSSDWEYLDALTTYDVYGSMQTSGYAGIDALSSHFESQAMWAEEARMRLTSFVPSVIPGYNDRGYRTGNHPLSRKVNRRDKNYGTLFEAMLLNAMNTVQKETGRMFLINSFNEWHEDTQIEPVNIAPPTSAHNFWSGVDHTEGLLYEGYGMRYLDILQRTLS